MALGLTTLTVVYDAVIAICRTWHKTSSPNPRLQAVTPADHAA